MEAPLLALKKYISDTSESVKEPSNFKKKYTFKQRQAEAQKVRRKYYNRIPVIVEIDRSSQNNLTIDKNKYLVPNDLTVGQLVYALRRRIQIDASQAIFIFVNNSIPSTSRMMSDIYREHAEPCGFVYMTISTESTFG
jgi:GABA(A) receptor-associated protein